MSSVFVTAAHLVRSTQFAAPAAGGSSSQRLACGSSCNLFLPAHKNFNKRYLQTSHPITFPKHVYFSLSLLFLVFIFFSCTATVAKSHWRQKSGSLLNVRGRQMHVQRRGQIFPCCHGYHTERFFVWNWCLKVFKVNGPPLWLRQTAAPCLWGLHLIKMSLICTHYQHAHVHTYKHTVNTSIANVLCCSRVHIYVWICISLSANSSYTACVRVHPRVCVCVRVCVV